MEHHSGLVRQLLKVMLLAIIAFGSTLAVLACGEGDNDRSTGGLVPVYTFDTDDYHALAFSPANDGTVLFGHHGGVQISTDRGKTWESIVDQSGWDAMNLAYDPFSTDTLYAAGHDVFYRSDDGGSSWSEVASDLPGLDLHAFTASAAEQGRLFAFAVGHGLYVSEGGPPTWRPLWPDAPQTTFSLLSLSDGTLLLAGGEAGLMRSEDGGTTWNESQDGIQADAVLAVKGDPSAQRLYAGTSDGLFVSTDGGMTWSNTALEAMPVLVVAVNPADPFEVMAINSDGELFHSRDGGRNWS